MYLKLRNTTIPFTSIVYFKDGYSYNWRGHTYEHLIACLSNGEELHLYEIYLNSKEVADKWLIKYFNHVKTNTPLDIYNNGE